ncbi:TetR family transcriptional regulator [Streptomyces sp. NPDC085481]|uniref:TetR family transcriptional regulator n=1 Tax=Streptomyces sp. NPDC085481 TaxID=3365727 RepID=UPI0037D1AAE6
MVSQERAERTRARLLHAAAGEFSLYGYGGTSLQRISGAAGVTMGALTFHFPTKMSLAGAVHTHGFALTRAAVAYTATGTAVADGAGRSDGSAPHLQRVIGITTALARLLHEEATVRAAGRLSRDRTLERDHWHEAWLPHVHELLEQAGKEGELRPGVNPHVVALLTRLLVSGLEESAQPGGGPPGQLGQLGAVWDVVLSGVGRPQG